MKQIVRTGRAGTALHTMVTTPEGVTADGYLIFSIEFHCDAAAAALLAGAQPFPVATLAPEETALDSGRRLYAEGLSPELLCGDCCADLIAVLRKLEA